MKQIFSINYLIYAMLILFVVSCSREDSLNLIDTEDKVFPGVQTEITIAVLVKSANGPLAGATVSNFSKSKISDNAGMAIITKAIKTDLGYTISVSKSGYFTETILIEDLFGNSNLTKEVVLTAEDDEYRVQGDSVLVTEVEEDIVLDIPALSVMNISGMDFNGNVNIAISLEELSVSNPINQGLIVVDGVNDRGLFVPSASIKVALSDDEGEPLVFTETGSLTITIPMNSSILASFEPDEIQNLDLTYVNTTGTLINQGKPRAKDGFIELTITKSGTYYLGSENNYNVDIINVVSEDLKTISNTKFRVSSSDQYSYLTSSDEEGNLSIYYSTEGGFSVELINRYHTRKSTATIGVESLTLPVLVKTITGSFDDCSGNSIEGYLYNKEVIGQVAPDGAISGLWFGDDFFQDSIQLVDTKSGDIFYVNNSLADISQDIDLGVISSCGGSGNQILSGNVIYDKFGSLLNNNTELWSEIFLPFARLYNENGNLIDTVPISNVGEFNFGERPTGVRFEVELELLPTINPDNLWIHTLLFNINILPRPDNPRRYSRVWEVGPSEVIFIAVDNIPGTVSGSVTRDTDGDGDGDEALEGEKLYLYLDDEGLSFFSPSLVAETTIGSNGFYEFKDVPNRKYIINYVGYENFNGTSFEEDASNDFPDKTDATNNGLIPVYLTPGENDGGNNFVITNERTSDGGAVSGTLLEDTNNDGVGDEPFFGATLYVHDVGVTGIGPDNSLYKLITGSDGTFVLSNIPEGDYQLQFDQSSVSVISAGGLGTVTLLSDEDESPEMDEALNTSQTDGIIPIKIMDGEEDTDNNFVFRRL